MPVYLDHNATSPMHAEAVEAILPFLRQPLANPSSLHILGRMAGSALETARAQVVGRGKAAELASLEMEQRRQYLSELRDAFEARLASIPGRVVFGQQAPRLPHTTYFAQPDCRGVLCETAGTGKQTASGFPPGRGIERQ